MIRKLGASWGHDLVCVGVARCSGGGVADAETGGLRFLEEPNTDRGGELLIGGN